MLRSLKITALGLALFLAAAIPALAQNGEGLAGETNDKIVTFFSLGVIVFFPLFIVVMNAIVGRLEKRKEQRQQAAARSGAGW